MTRRKVTRTRRGRPRGGRTHGPTSRAWIAIGGVVGVIAVAAIVAVGTSGDGDGQDPATASASAVAITGDPLPAFTPEDDGAVGQQAPELAGEDFEGRPTSVREDGRPKAVLFLAHWCPHCQREVPLVQGWLDSEGMPEGVDLYSVSTGMDPSQPNYPPEEWLRREGWIVPVLVDDPQGSAADAFGLTGFPFFVFVDEDGNVVSRAAGELTIERFQEHLAEISPAA